MRITEWSKVDMKWYFGVLCQKCGSPILFALDRSDGASVPAHAAKLVLTCSLAGCRHQADYSGATISRFQKQPDVTNGGKNQ